MKGAYEYTHVSTVGGATVVASATPAKLGGFFLHGSGGGSTITVKDGATTILSTSAGANALIPVVFASPVAMRTSILGTCSGTGYYSILIST